MTRWIYDNNQSATWPISKEYSDADVRSEYKRLKTLPQVIVYGSYGDGAFWGVNLNWPLDNPFIFYFKRVD